MIKQIKNKFKKWWAGEVVDQSNEDIFCVYIKRPWVVEKIIWIIDGLKKHWKYWLSFMIAIIGLAIKFF